MERSPPPVSGAVVLMLAAVLVYLLPADLLQRRPLEGNPAGPGLDLGAVRAGEHVVVALDRVGAGLPGVAAGAALAGAGAGDRPEQDAVLDVAAVDPPGPQHPQQLGCEVVHLLPEVGVVVGVTEVVVAG